jgi:hypothetical protein
MKYHAGFQAFSRAVLEALPLDANSDAFVFDNEMLAPVRVFRFSNRRAQQSDEVF